MRYQQPTPLQFEYDQEQVIFFIQGTTGIQLAITCEHPTFNQKFKTNTFICEAALGTCLLPERDHSDYEFFRLMYQAIEARHNKDYDDANESKLK